LNILFIANRFPYPPYRGDKLKIFNLAKRLANRHNLFLATFIQDKDDYHYLDQLRCIFDEIIVVYLPRFRSVLRCAMKLFSRKPFQIVYFESKKLQERISEFISKNRIDIIHTQHLRMAQYSYGFDNVRTVIDLPDAYSLYWKRRSSVRRNLALKMFDRLEFRKILQFEKIIEHFDLALVCSEEDREFLSRQHTALNIQILPNGVDTEVFSPAPKQDYSISNRIIFTGNMDYSPNVDAVCYFSRKIFPLILRELPDAQFYIVGQNPVSRVVRLESDNIHVKGFVEDLASEYRLSSVAVSPVRYGAGTLNKVLEPLATGVPVVSTNIGFQGLGLKAGEGVILANGEEDFAQAVINLLKDQNLRRDVGLRGQTVIRERYDWGNIAAMLENYFLELEYKSHVRT